MAEFAVAIVGAGGISRAHIAAAKATAGRVRVVGVVDPNDAARMAASDAAGARGFAELDALLDSDAGRHLGGVIVCTPPSVRVPIVETALARGIAVLAEKPLAHTLDDAQTLASLAQKHSNVATAVGYCHRFTPAVIEMNRRIHSGAIGEVTRFENTFAAPLLRMKDHWMSDPAVSGGGSFIDTGCHSLDLFLHLLGPGRVKSAVFAHAWRGRGESSATVLMQSERGVAGVIQSGWTEPARFIVRVVGTRGALTYDYDHATSLRLAPNDGPEQAIEVETHDLRFQRQIEAFADAASGQTPAIRPATFAEALWSAERVDEAKRLAR